MFMPTHEIYLVRKDGTMSSICLCDCSTKKEVRQEVKRCIEDYYDDKKDEFVKAQYVDKNEKVLYECTIKECMEEL